MKQAWLRFVQKDETNERLQMISTIFLVMLFITFWAAGFYVLINSFA